MYDTTKKAAAIHDISGYGRASLTVVMPILSAMGVQVCPMPTAVLSNHTTLTDSYSCVDLTDTLDDFIAQWKMIGIDFDCIYSGFLASEKQIDTVSRFTDDFKRKKTVVVVDPVMGDDGKIYDAFTPSFVEKMRELVKKADIITPNMTEAALLLGYDPQESAADDELLKKWLRELSGMGPEKVVITSAPVFAEPNTISAVTYDKSEDKFRRVCRPKIPGGYSGTGDAFTSVLIGGILKGNTLPESLGKAADFMYRCLKSTYEIPGQTEFLLEKNLGRLFLPDTCGADEF